MVTRKKQTLPQPPTVLMVGRKKKQKHSLIVIMVIRKKQTLPQPPIVFMTTPKNELLFNSFYYQCN
jgi:hypothetical protein